MGISGFTVRPPQARREKPKVSAFTSAKIERIVALKPDLVLGFSDLQAGIAADLIRAGIEVHVFNQRGVGEILESIAMLGRMIGARARPGPDRTAAPLHRRCPSRRISAALSAARLFRGMGRSADLRHPLGRRARRNRRRGELLCGPRRAACRQGAHHRRSVRGGSARPRRADRLVVRKEVQPGKSARAARLGIDSGAPPRSIIRDQIVRDPAARARGPHRRFEPPPSDHRRQRARHGGRRRARAPRSGKRSAAASRRPGSTVDQPARTTLRPLSFLCPGAVGLTADAPARKVRRARRSGAR